MATRGTLTIAETSWHARLYRWWQDNGGNTPGRENLCHYVRTVLFWAPVKFFVKAHPKKVEWLTPALAFIFLAVTAGLVATIVIWPIEFLQVLISAVVIFAAAVLIALGIAWMDRNPEKVKRFFRSIGNFLAPLGRVLVMFGSFIADTWMALVVIAAVASVIFFAAAWYIWSDTINPIILTVLIWTAGIAAFLVAVVLLVLIIFGYIEPRVRRWWRNRVPREDPGMLRVTGRYVVAKKHRICPFIDFQEHK